MSINERRLTELQAEITALRDANKNGSGPEVGKPGEDPFRDARRDALDQFTDLAHIPEISRVTQEGRDPTLARFTLHLADERKIEIGTIKQLWSRAEFAKVLAVRAGLAVATVKPSDWTAAVTDLIAYGTEVDEAEDERFEEVVRDWVSLYTSRAQNDRENAARGGEPFFDAKDVYLTAGGLAYFARSRLGERVETHEIRRALKNLGLRPARVTFNRVRGKRDTRTSAGYYWGSLELLETVDDPVTGTKEQAA